jgi:hypothetical protein
MKWLRDAYWWLWYHVEILWIKVKEQRRPFTFMMRDFLIQHKVWSTFIILGQVGVLFWGNLAHPGALFFVSAFYFALFAHLIWGSPIKENEQEDPPYIEPEH